MAGETPADILTATERVADWQLAHLDTAHKPTRPDDQASPRGWVYGTLFAGLQALADVAPSYGDAVVAHGRRENWDLEVRTFHADDYLIGQSWVWAYERKRDPAMIAAVKTRLDSIIAASPKVPLEYGSNPPPYVESACQQRWCWADSLFMGPQVFAALSRASGDPKYLAYADAEYWATVDFLFDKTEHLMARDSRFFSRRGAYGEKIFWSRGNGWVYAGLARMLQLLPAGHPSRPRYEALFREMSARLITLQKPDGYWPVSLLSPPANTPPETSGTAFYTYGLAYGVRTGLLTGQGYRDAATRGWSALVRAVQPDGRLGWVQQIGVGPDAVHAGDTQLFGVGAFLLAGSEMYTLKLADLRAATVRQSPVAATGYALGNTNAVSMARNALISAGGYQFASLYGAAKDGRVPLLIARRKLGTDGWQVATTPFSLADIFSNAGVRDDHNLIAAGIDKAGRLHLSWGMHNIPLNYAVSAQSVLGEGFAPAGHLGMSVAVMLGRDENEVTYPEFFHAPDGTLLFSYRNGGAGGGSGNGNAYLNRYDDGKKRWQRVASPLVDGISTSMNAYLNSFAYDKQGTLYASWTIRETPDWRSNHDVYLVRSADGGRTWQSFSGVKLGPTITRTVADGQAKILSLPVNSNLINQTSMNIDTAGRPQIATWWSPRIGEGDPTRQYMLIWHDGQGWRVSQVSDRAAHEADPSPAEKVREMGRPLVLTDSAGRTLVVTRASASAKAISDDSNRLTVYWSEDRIHWAHMDLADENPGVWEPVYDLALWQHRNILDLFFQPSGLGHASAPVSVLSWDAATFFADPARVRVAHATIPARVDGRVREVPSITVPKSHTVHDPLFPIEGVGIESDRIGYRVYLDGRNAVDVFGKKLPGIVLNRIGQGGGSYHDASDWGMDFWHVGDSLGAGSLGVLDKGMARQIGDPHSIETAIEIPDGDAARLRITDRGFSVGDRKADLTAHYGIAAGSRLLRVDAAASAGVPLVAGIAKYPGTVLIRRGAKSGWAYVATWGRQSENGKDNVGMALFYPVSRVARAGDDGRSLYVLFRNPAKARYAVAAAWDKETGGVATEAAFRAYLDASVAELNRKVVLP